MRCCINKTVSISSDPFELFEEGGSARAEPRRSALLHNRTKKLVLAVGLTVLGGATAFGEFARGYFNNWANNCPLERPEGGNY